MRAPRVPRLLRTSRFRRVLRASAGAVGATGVLGAVVLAATGLVGSRAAGAQIPAGFEQISRYDVRIVIEPDGDLRVREVIDYDFGQLERHGIFRTIPYRFRYEPVDPEAGTGVQGTDPDETWEQAGLPDLGARYDRVMPIEDIEVRSPTAPDDVEVTRDGGEVAIRIGDPDIEITGEHRYVIEYRVRGALNAFAEHDELYWNAIGVEWSVPIERATVQVEGPGRITRVACFRGPAGATTPCDRADREGRTASFSGALLFPYEGLTVVVALPKGTVLPEPFPILEERWSLGRAFSTDRVHVGAAGLVAVLGIAGVVTAGWVQGRDRELAASGADLAFAPSGTAEEAEPVPLLRRIDAPVEYVPPDGIRPGLVGTLLDEVAHPLDVSATIVDLAVRGFVRIEETERPGLFRKGDWKLVRLAADREDRLLEYERHLLAGLFGTGDEVELSDLRNTFAARMRAVQGKLYDETVRRGWFVRRPDKVRTLWTALAIGAVVLAIGAAVALAALTTFGWVGVALLLVALAFLAVAPRMPRRTPAGRAALRRVVGFRRFIEESEEGERARFAEQAHLFTEYLPYAIVFGATEKWARAFGDLADQADSSWYVSGRPFTAHLLADSLSDFAVATSGVLTSTPAGSGGSGFSSGGGGGFSGGGGGGGGGGSW